MKTTRVKEPQTMTGTPRMQRSEDGINWSIIDPQVARRTLANHYRDVDLVLAAMADGQEVRTPYAVYRITKP